MDYIRLFAHNGEVHDTTTEATSHLVTAWYIALPLFLLAVAGFAMIIHLMFRKPDVTAIATSIVLLISGFTMYQVSSVISVISLTGGLILAMGLTLFSLQAPADSQKGSK